ncbi:Alpha/Beta hydrolase protein [Xylariales sp. AK1849]|nr:Alpha/Beta hydrolase protein [Xylariales sp. AK1849]
MNVDEKRRPGGGSFGTAKREGRSPLKSLAFAALVCFAVYHLSSHFPATSRHCHDGGLEYPGEHILWRVCGDLKGRDLECSELDVPMDQFDAENSGNKTFSLPLIRLRGKNATQNLILNPGGPGGSGIEFIYRKGEEINAIVGEGYHLLSFDPRGVNGSKPLASCYPDKEARRSHASVRNSKIIEDSPEIYAWTQNYVKACRDTMGDHGKYINTPQTAADMNSILDAVGQDDMVYWGFSYGTLLGQTYAGLFPNRSKRVIIDGVVNMFDWYDNPFDAESLADTENVLHGFFDECVKAGKHCSLSGLAESKEELLDKVMSFTYKLQEQPLSVYVNNTVYGLLDREKVLFTGVFPAMYKPANWYTLADRLAKLLKGNATDAFLAWGSGEPWSLVGDSNAFVTLNDGVSGPRHFPQDRQTFLDMIVPVVNESLFGPSVFDYYYGKQQWAVPRTHHFVPKLGFKTAHPLLILSTTYDPVCPLISARSANAAFEGSQIVEVKGYGHCSISVPSNCLAHYVRDFLYNGSLPANYTQCKADGPYFVKPEEDGTTVAVSHFDDSEEQRIHEAQVKLARDPEWPIW